MKCHYSGPGTTLGLVIMSLYFHVKFIVLSQKMAIWHLKIVGGGDNYAPLTRNRVDSTFYAVQIEWNFGL